MPNPHDTGDSITDLMLWINDVSGDISVQNSFLMELRKSAVWTSILSNAQKTTIKNGFNRFLDDQITKLTEIKTDVSNV